MKRFYIFNMNSNKLKFIACVSMLIDHAGLLLFPSQIWMRYVGRIAMPIFGFFIAEGARYTKSRTRYFVRTFLLGAACQAVYAVEEILSGGIRSVYLNILFTLSFSMLICFAYIDFEKALKNADNIRIFTKAGALFCAIFAIGAFEIFCTCSKELIGISLSFDYGFAGAILPLFALFGKGRKSQLVSFSIGLIFFALLLQSTLWYIWFALLSIPILICYNGERGSKRFKYAFYIFYPIHLGVLYLIDTIM